jgi:hypothetical protein
MGIGQWGWKMPLVNQDRQVEAPGITVAPSLSNSNVR